MDNVPTYADLFAILANLGFQDLSTNKLERVFEHGDSDTVLAFSMIGEMDEQSPIRPADLVSARTHLQTKGFMSNALEALIRTHAEARDEVP